MQKPTITPVALPKDEPEVPVPARNPMQTTFLQRVLLQYQVLPDGHPFNPAELGLSPDDLKRLEEAGLMPEIEKVLRIKQRDRRWERGLDET